MSEGLVFNMVGGSAGIKLSSIAIITAPTKTTYTAGETFNPAGMVVEAIYSNGAKAVATGYTYMPNTALTDGTTEVTIQYTEGGVTAIATQSVTVAPRLVSISITTSPAKTTYEYGDAFSSSGMVVEATYSNGSTATVTGYTCSPTTLNTVGTQTITVSYAEKDVTVTTTLTVTVKRKSISAVPSQSGTLTYTGSAQSPSWNNYDSSKMTLSMTAQTNAGTYSASFTPKDDYMWSDETTAAKTVNWTIGRATISTVPSQSGSLTYTGSAQSPSWNNYDSSKMTIGGTTSSTNAGTFAATFTPNGNHKWSDGTITAKSVNWQIKKAAGSLSLSKSSITLNSTTKSTTFTVTRAGNGTITVKSSDTSVVTVSVSGTKVTVKSVNDKTGTATITVSVAAGTNHTAPSNKTCAVSCEFLPAIGTALNDISWADIKRISDAGLASSYFAVGDRKAVALSGTAGSLFLSGTYYCYIIGIDHNSAKEGTNRIHFQFGYTAASGGVRIAFIDSGYLRNYTSGSYFNMNNANSNSGGWANSRMRTTIIPTFKACLPSDLQAVLKTVTKYSDNTGGGSNTASYVTATTDDIFLLAEWEVFGARRYANSAEQNYQARYAYYSAGNSKVRYRHSSTGSTAYWWLRSVYAATSASFCAVGTSGSAVYNNAGDSFGFAPAFCV